MPSSPTLKLISPPWARTSIRGPCARLQRPFRALVGQSSPLFLVNGNHEQAAAANLDGTPLPFVGPLRDYYAWTWGDVLILFMV